MAARDDDLHHLYESVHYVLNSLVRGSVNFFRRKSPIQRGTTRDWGYSIVGEIDLVSDDEFNRIVEAYRGMIWRICGAYEADPELRSDLHQETLIAVWRALSRFRGEANVRTYIARIAHNRAISHVAKEVSRPKLAELHDDIETTDPSPEDYTATSIRNGKLQAAIRRLPLDQRQPITLTLEGFTPKEIAEVLGVTANAVSIRMTRAKATLKEQFKDED